MRPRVETTETSHKEDTLLNGNRATARSKRQTPATAAARKVLQERLLRGESGLLSPSEILGLLLTYGLPIGPARRVADSLLDTFGDIKGVINASAEELSRCSGVGPRQSLLVRLVREILELCSAPPPIPREILGNPKELERYLLARMSPMKEEALLLIFLNRQGEVLGQELLGAGTVDQVVMFPRQVMERALRFNASSLMVIHNHPHGPPLPSVRDREEAERLRGLLLPFDVSVLDAIVVGSNRCFSIFRNAPL
jgi:DNA repair protein RadC